MTTTMRTSRFSPDALTWAATALGGAHLIFVAAMGILRPEHVLGDVLLVGLAWLGGRFRVFVAGALPIWLAGVLLDSQKYYVLPWRGTIHTGDMWKLGSSIFPATLHGQVTTWSAWFAAHATPALDLLCGFGYLTYLLEVFGVMLALFFLKSPRFRRFTWAFFLLNVIGLFVYTVFPAAPPWYVMRHGLGPADLATVVPSAAGAARFDALLGIHYFQDFYRRNPNVFGAMPSLHVAYTVMVVWQTWSRGIRWRIGTMCFSVLVAFAAVYLGHHYILDVLAGICAASVAALAVDAVAGWSARARADRAALEGGIAGA